MKPGPTVVEPGVLKPESETAEDARLELEPEILAAIAAGRKLEAIKLLRVEYGMGLTEAKEIADELMIARDATAETRARTGLHGRVGAKHSLVKAATDGRSSVAGAGMPRPMQMETGRGRLIVVVVITALVAGFYWGLG